MRRFSCILMVVLFLTPRSSSAIQLKWISGTSDLTFTAATRCTLMVQADSAEVTLPGQWRLLWVADSSGVNTVAADSLWACQTDTAKVSSIDRPYSPADSAANQFTAHFCSAGSVDAATAYFVLDLVGGSQGKLKVVAMDPTDPDSSRVIESSEVTFNGGIDGAYPPALLRASSTHETALLQVTAVGIGLSAVTSLRVGAADNLWSVPLTIVQQDDSSILATADVPAALPEATLQAVNLSGASSLVSLAADQIEVSVITAGAGIDTILFRDPTPGIYPKDFAFYYNSIPDPMNPGRWKGVFHLFYIRAVRATAEDSILAHAWCDTLGAPWTVDTHAFRPSGTGWDAMRIWAPSIQKIGDLYYMFYTGVDAQGNQSIGYATTPLLGTTNISWTRQTAPVYEAVQTGWADATGQGFGGDVQFRDPFVIPDPNTTQYPGRYLMFVAGGDGASLGHMVVGAARSQAGSLQTWNEVGAYRMTGYPLSGITRAESPLVVQDSLTGAWRMFVANGDYDPQGYYSTIFYTQVQSDSVTDLIPANWPGRDSLYRYVGEDADVIGWQACEHLQIGQVHFFAAYVGPDGIGITQMHWDSVAQRFIFVHPSMVDVGDVAPSGGVRFYVSDWGSGRAVVRFRLEAPSAVRPKLVMHDLAGRRVKVLLSGRETEGLREILWDGRDEQDKPVPTGMYFARLTSSTAVRVLRVPIVR